MTIGPTGRALRHAVNESVAETVRRSLRDLGWSDARLAGTLSLSTSRVEAWWTESANAPLSLLAHPHLPALVVARLVSEVLALRPATDSGALSAETAAADLVSAVGRVTMEIAASIASGTFVRESLRKAIATLRDVCDAWLRVHAQKAGVFV